ncbi:MAG: hypothetical protein ACE14M_12270 [Terriglobales bacterium]
MDSPLHSIVLRFLNTRDKETWMAISVGIKPQGEASLDATVASAVSEVLDYLDRTNVPFVVVAGLSEFPARISSDVDIVTRPFWTKAVGRRLCSRAVSVPATLVNHFQYHYGDTYVLSVANGARFVWLDCSSDFRTPGRTWISCQEILQNVTRATRFPEPTADIAFLYQFIKRVTKGSLPHAIAEWLSNQWQKNPERARLRVTTLWNQQLAAMIEDAADSGNWSNVRANLPAISDELHARGGKQHFGATFANGCAEVLRRIKRFSQPTGVFVAVMGSDGSGKSSVIDAMQSTVAGAFRNSATYHLRPDCFRTARRMGIPVTNPHANPPRGLAASIAKIAYFAADYCFGYWIKLRPKLVRSTLIVFDRYFHDLLVDPRRYRYGAPTYLARLVGHVIPKPDVWIFLDAPAEVLQQRKPEVSHEESVRQRDAYLDMAGGLRNAFVIDATQPLERVIADVNKAILTFLAERTATRLGIEPAHNDS